MPLVNFPTYTSRFIGRETDATAVAETVQAHQLVSLVGTSGTGKTRLSQQIAQQLEPHFPDGCVFVSLAAVYEPEQVIPTLATSLDIRLIDETLPLDHLQEQLANKHMLLVLDNVEQVIAAAPALVTLLQHCAQVHTLVTSQEPLQVDEEVVIRIPPLDIPPTTQDYTAQELLRFPAVALFVDRLKAIQPHFSLTQQTMPLVKEICQRLYGLPLALELVAANSRQMPLRDVLLLLKNYLPPLDSGVPLRRSDIIQPVLDWCYKIMPPALQRIYPQLGVFHGGWTQATAEQVCEIIQPGLTIESVHRWFEARHLVLAEELSDGSLRYSMVDAVVEDVRRRLAATMNPQTYHASHAEAFASLVTFIDHQSRQPDQSVIKWFDHLEYERANIRAALNWSLEQQRFPLAARITSALGRFWMTRGDVHEAMQWFEALLEHKTKLAAELAGVQYGAGLIYFRLGRHDAAQEVWEQSVVWYEAQGDNEWASRLWNALATLASNRGEFAQARHWFEQARQVHQHNQHEALEGLVVSNIALSYAREGRFEDAIRLYQEAQTLGEKTDSADVLSTVIGNMGCCYVELDDYDVAIPLLQRSIELHQQTNRPFSHTMSRYLATAHLRRKDFATAYPLVCESFEQCIATTNKLEIGYGLGLLAEWFWSTNQHQQAAQAWRLALYLFEQLNLPQISHNQYAQQLIRKLEHFIADHNQQFTPIDQDTVEQQIAELTAYLQAHPHTT